MRYILIFLLLSTNSFAAGWMTEADIAKVNADQHPTTIYSNRGKCPAPCLEISGKDLRRASVQSIQVDDLSKPLYGSKLKSQAAIADLAACQALMPNHCNGLTPGYAVRPVCADELPSSTYELYCIAASPQSYQQMTAKRLLIDAGLLASANAADAAQALAKSNKSAAKNRWKNADLSGNLTLPQMQAILKDLVESQK